MCVSDYRSDAAFVNPGRPHLPGETLPETQLAFPTRSTYSLPPPVDWMPGPQSVETKEELAVSLAQMGGEGLSLRAVSGAATTRRPPRMRGGAAATADAAAAEVRWLESRALSPAANREGGRDISFPWVFG